MTDFTVQSGGLYTIADGDRLLLTNSLKAQDKAGVGVAKNASNDVWTFEYWGPSSTLNFRVTGSAALRFVGMEGSLFAYTLPIKTVIKEVIVTPPAPKVYAQRNGMSLSNSQNGYYEDVATQVAAYVIDGGARAMRIPIHRSVLWQNGTIQDAVSLGGYSTKQWPKLKAILDFNIANNVVSVIDDHSYSPYGNTDLLPFWTALGQKLKATYGDNDLIKLELQNETNSGNWETGYAANLKTLTLGIRAAGINYPLIAGWGCWNAVGYYGKALAEIDSVGGVVSFDPLGKLEFSAHHYPTTTGNDKPSSGQTAAQIKNGSVYDQFVPMFDEFKKRGLKIWITEIGAGGSGHAWLSNGSNVPTFDGKAWFNQFTGICAKYPDTLAGVLMWGGGQAWKDDYPFKIEYTKGDWTATKSTDLWRSATAFWQNKHIV
jgi:hypothetical protein